MFSGRSTLFCEEFSGKFSCGTNDSDCEARSVVIPDKAVRETGADESKGLPVFIAKSFCKSLNIRQINRGDQILNEVVNQKIGFSLSREFEQSSGSRIPSTRRQHSNMNIEYAS